jgi:hypothetical protein
MILKLYFAYHNQWAKNTITVKLEKTKKLVIHHNFKKFTSNAQAEQRQIETVHSSGQVHFITHGLDNSVPEEYVAFQEKIWYKFQGKGNVLDPITVKNN